MSKIGIDKRIRANLIKLRTKDFLSQKCLAEKAQISHLAQIESGARSAGIDVLIKLANALDVDIYEFFLPEDVRVIKKEDEKICCQLLAALSKDGRKFIYEVIIQYIKLERKFFK